MRTVLWGRGSLRHHDVSNMRLVFRQRIRVDGNTSCWVPGVRLFNSFPLYSHVYQFMGALDHAIFENSGLVATVRGIYHDYLSISDP